VIAGRLRAEGVARVGSAAVAAAAETLKWPKELKNALLNSVESQDTSGLRSLLQRALNRFSSFTLKNRILTGWGACVRMPYESACVKPPKSFGRESRKS